MILQILTDMKKFIITSIITVLIAATTTTETILTFMQLWIYSRNPKRWKDLKEA
jgi:cytochrome P450